VHSSQFTFFSQQTALFFASASFFLLKEKNPILLNNKNSIFGIVCAFVKKGADRNIEKY
jgi:hypothetical protein